MKKQLILVGGAMGVGKSAVCRELLRQLTPGVWLDGDWCWNMTPFVVSEENKRMVLSNITHLLRAYLNNSSYRYVLFCWVMDQPLLFLPRRPVPSGPVPAFAGPGETRHSSGRRPSYGCSDCAGGFVGRQGRHIQFACRQCGVGRQPPEASRDDVGLPDAVPYVALQPFPQNLLRADE